MPAVGRSDSTSDHGGLYSVVTTRTYVNGLMVLTKDASHHCPIPGHGTTLVVEGSSIGFAEGRAVARIGDAAGCGARVATGSPDTFDGG